MGQEIGFARLLGIGFLMGLLCSLILFAESPSLEKKKKDGRTIQVFDDAMFESMKSKPPGDTSVSPRSGKERAIEKDYIQLNRKRNREIVRTCKEASVDPYERQRCIRENRSKAAADIEAGYNETFERNRLRQKDRGGTLPDILDQR